MGVKGVRIEANGTTDTLQIYTMQEFGWIPLDQLYERLLRENLLTDVDQVFFSESWKTKPLFIQINYAMNTAKRHYDNRFGEGKYNTYPLLAIHNYYTVVSSVYSQHGSL